MIIKVGEKFDTGSGAHIRIDAGEDGSIVVLSSAHNPFLFRMREDGMMTNLDMTPDLGQFSYGYVETMSDGRYVVYSTNHFGQGTGTRIQIYNRDGSAATGIINPMFEHGQDRVGYGFTVSPTLDGGFAFVWTDASRASDTIGVDYSPSNGHTHSDVSAGTDVRVRYFDAAGEPLGASFVSDDDIESINGATTSRRASDQHINDSATLANGSTAFAYIDTRWVGSSGGGAHTEMQLSLQISSPGNPGEPVKVDIGPFGEQFGQYPQTLDGTAGANIVALPDGTLAVIWSENTYVPANVWGNYALSGTQSLIRYYDAAGNALTDPITIVTRGTDHGNHSRYVHAEAMADGRIAIAYNVGIGGVNGNGTLDAFVGVVGPLGSSLEVAQINPAATNGQFYPVGDIAVRSDGSIEVVYQDALSNNRTMIERFGVEDAGEVVENGTAGGDTIAGGGLDDLIFGLGGADTLTGSAGRDGLHGGADNDYLHGGSGADRLFGGAGADRMEGGTGDDFFTVDHSDDRVIEDANEGHDRVEASASFSIAGQHVETLTLVGTANINAVGNGLANNLTGNSGANLLNGAGGADRMEGLAGNDRYIVDHAGDLVVEAAGGGTDRVESAVTYALGDHVENLALTGNAAISGTGNGGANSIVGNSAGNVIDGGGGADIMEGKAGNDRYVVDDAGAKVMESLNAGTDTVESSVSFSLAGQYIELLRLTGGEAIDATGNNQANSLFGNAAANKIGGGGGDDKIYGGQGNDQLTGGTGLDRFIFDTAPGAGTNADRIMDFTAADDSIYLDRSVFGAVNGGTLAAASFVAGTAAADSNDRIVYDSATGNIFYDADGNGTGGAILFATVNAGTVLTNADFIGF